MPAKFAPFMPPDALWIGRLRRGESIMTAGIATRRELERTKKGDCRKSTMSKADLAAVLNRRRPRQCVHAPNYWQWFSHQIHHGTLAPDIAGCRSQLEVIRHLGLDVFSRNIYSDQERGWFGGLAEVVLSPGVTCDVQENRDGRDLVLVRTYRTPAGALTERQRYVFAESTLVQEKFLIDDYASQLDAFEALLGARRWRFLPERYQEWQCGVQGDGLVVAGELHSPLKMLHFLLGPENTTFLLADYPERAAELLARHEAAMLDLVRQIAAAGVRVMMSMDNLDTAFHPPHYVERYSARYYEKAAALCHQYGSLFFIHACGNQRGNLKLIGSLGVDGLEGVTFPPLGDVELDDALRLSGDRLIVTGGISAMEYDKLATRQDIFAYTRNLLARLQPYAHRFIFTASCGTPYTAPWEKIVHFRDACREFGAC